MNELYKNTLGEENENVNFIKKLLILSYQKNGVINTNHKIINNNTTNNSNLVV